MQKMQILFSQYLLEKAPIIFFLHMIRYKYENDWRYPNEKKDYFDTCAGRSHSFDCGGGIWGEALGTFFLFKRAR